MSLHGIVHCNCHKEGKTAPHPHAQYLMKDVEGWWLELPDAMWKADEDMCYRMENEHDEWLETCCAHPNMELVSERVANVTGMAQFHHMLNRLNTDGRYTLLLDHVKEGVAHFPAGSEPELLERLRELAKEKTKEDRRFLRELGTMTVIASVAADTYWIFSFLAGGLMFGLDGEGFMVLERKDRGDGAKLYVRFRGTHIVQTPIGDGRYQFLDIYSKEIFISPSPIWQDADENKKVIDINVQFSERSIGRYYASIVESLIILAEAAIASGNPIVWT